jgi:hypothetical protein
MREARGRGIERFQIRIRTVIRGLDPRIHQDDSISDGLPGQARQ